MISGDQDEPCASTKELTVSGHKQCQQSMEDARIHPSGAAHAAHGGRRRLVVAKASMSRHEEWVS